ncbi:MAG TPA: molybdopterin-guanine dinucleotide biosynthesis protein A [Alphaproteobacteria bacterium]|nr:molybdopterin-guanine dinucleotide biosynthesis protein A [Alphaproteobacteria bacterium]
MCYADFSPAVKKTLFLCIGLALLVACPLAAQASDRHSHEGYYYPRITSSEVYKSAARVEPGATRKSRLAFIVGYTSQQLSRAYAPNISMFAKGDNADDLIIVALDDGVMRTLYRARAVLAQMTSIARSTNMFNDMGVADTYTFFDLAKMIGFKQITVSDGATYAHRIVLK